MELINAVVDAVFTKNNLDYPIDLRAYPMDAVCFNCTKVWGEHSGEECPDGKTVFKSQRQQIMEEIEANEAKEAK